MGESYLQWAQCIEYGDYVAVAGGGVVHKPGRVKKGEQDSYDIAMCRGRFSARQVELLEEDAVVTCLWCVAERIGDTVEWFTRG